VSETETAAVSDVVRAAEEEEDACAVTVAEGSDDRDTLTDADADRDAIGEREIEADTVCEDDTWLLSVIESETSDEREPETDAVADLLRAGERLTVGERELLGVVRVDAVPDAEIAKERLNNDEDEAERDRAFDAEADGLPDWVTEIEAV
jgi:hypothetical protein